MKFALLHYTSMQITKPNAQTISAPSMMLRFSDLDDQSLVVDFTGLGNVQSVPLVCG